MTPDQRVRERRESPGSTSTQYDVGMEYFGHVPQCDEVVFRGDRDGGEFVAFWHVQALVRSRPAIDVAALTDPLNPLESLAAEAAAGTEEQRA